MSYPWSCDEHSTEDRGCRNCKGVRRDALVEFRAAKADIVHGEQWSKAALDDFENLLRENEGALESSIAVLAEELQITQQQFAALWPTIEVRKIASRKRSGNNGPYVYTLVTPETVVSEVVQLQKIIAEQAAQLIEWRSGRMTTDHICKAVKDWRSIQALIGEANVKSLLESAAKNDKKVNKTIQKAIAMAIATPEVITDEGGKEYTLLQ